MSGRIERHSGVFLDPTDLDEGLVDIEDIAFSAARVPRFSGDVNFSVGEHCLEVQRLLEGWGDSPLLQLQALLHDAAECMGLMDFARPIKYRMPEYRKIEHRALKRIFGGLGVPFPAKEDRARIKIADRLSAILEARQDLPSQARASPERDEWSEVTPEVEEQVTRAAYVLDDVLLRVARLERDEDLSRQGAIRVLFLRQYEALRRDANV